MFLAVHLMCSGAKVCEIMFNMSDSCKLIVSVIRIKSPVMTLMRA